jgi:hypothetical protein
MRGGLQVTEVCSERELVSLGTVTCSGFFGPKLCGE